MAKNYDNIRVYGDLDSGVYVGEKGATGPTDLSEPAEHEELGWLSEDGISFDRAEEATSFRAHQGGQVVRRKKTSVEDTFTFQCLEETARTMGLRFAGQKPVLTEAGGDVARIKVANQTKDDARSWVVDEIDGDVTTRYVIPVGHASSGTLAYSNANMTVYEFTVTVVGDYEILTNSPGVVEGAEDPDGAGNP